jgi:ornithine carbamoyltransferase
MTPDFQQRLLVSAPLDAADERALLATARALKRAARSGRGGAPLRGKNIAVLCAEQDCRCAEDFDHVASALGAHVSRIAPEPDWIRGDLSAAPEATRLLGRLYDAIGCEEVPPGFAQRLHRQVGVPVYDRLARGDHPIAHLVSDLSEPDATPDPEDRRFLMQAVLLETIGR